MSNPAEPSDWPPILDRLIAGVAHHISNRIAVLSGISELLAANPALPAPLRNAFASEVPKLEEALRLLRLLPGNDEPPEATEPIRLVNDALTLAALHPELKAFRYSTTAKGDIPPVLARPTALTHEILTAVVYAARESTTGSVSVELTADDERVLVTVGRYAVPAQTLSVARRARLR